MTNSEFKKILHKKYENMTMTDFITLYMARAISIDFLIDINSNRIFSSWKNINASEEIKELENFIFTNPLYIRIFVQKYPKVIQESKRFSQRIKDEYPFEGIGSSITKAANRLLMRISHKPLAELSKSDVKILYKFNRFSAENFERISHINEEEIWHELALEDPKALKTMPEKYFNSDFCDKCFEVYRTTSLLPEKYRKQYMKSEESVKQRTEGIIYFKRAIHLPTIKNFEQVPQNLLTQSLCQEFFYKNPSLMPLFPVEYITSNMVQTIFEQYPDKIKNISFQAIPSQISLEFCQKNHDNIKLLPPRAITEAVVTEVLEYKDGNYTNLSLFKYIPPFARNKDMCMAALREGTIRFEETGLIYTGPNGTIKGRISIEPEDYSELISLGIINKQMVPKDKRQTTTTVINDDIDVKKQLEEEFKNLSKSGLTLRHLREKYNIQNRTIFKVLSDLECIHPGITTEVQQIFDTNENAWVHQTISDALVLKDILEVLQISAFTDLTKEQKIYFSYLYDKAYLNTNLRDIYMMIIEKPELATEVSDVKQFLSYNLGLFLNNPANGKSGNRLNALYQNELRNNGEWFTEYNHEEKFFTKDGKPITNKYLTSDNQTLELDAATGIKIVDYLITNGISTRKCVVNEAFRLYARGELESFVNDLNSGEYLSKNENNKTI